MKNIHVLPTDKPSRLHITSKLDLYPNGVSRKPQGLCKNQHIYITTDEEVKEGDWFLEKAGRQYPIQWNGVDKLNRHCKKIILTTDQDLIEDGIQPIDDEFLEWFVKNPDCKFVPIITTTVSKESTYKTNIGFESWRKEEPSQDKRMYSEEEVLDILRKSHSIEQTSKMDSWITKWFNQIKNK